MNFSIKRSIQTAASRIGYDIKQIIGREGSHFDRRHKIDALHHLANIESYKGKTDPKLIRLSDEYAADVYGWSGYAPWLYAFSAMAGEFREGWIPDNYYGRYVVAAMNGAYGQISALKPMSRSIYRTEELPDLAYLINGNFYDLNHEFLGRDQVENYLFSKADRIVFKIDHTLQGDGVYVLQKDDFDLQEIVARGNGVFQSHITQHAEFAALSPDAVATLRITTVIDDAGRCTARTAYLRLGQSGESHVRSATGIRVACSLETGELSETGYQAGLKPIQTHPGTQARFKGFAVPRFHDCVARVRQLHSAIPFARSVGWDVTIDLDNDIKLIEWNAEHNDIKFSEAVQGPCFADLQWHRIRKDYLSGALSLSLTDMK